MQKCFKCLIPMLLLVTSFVHAQEDCDPQEEECVQYDYRLKYRGPTPEEIDIEEQKRDSSWPSQRSEPLLEELTR